MERARFLVTPGPTEISTRVLRAQVMPAIEPGDPSFVQVMDETTEFLNSVFKTENDVVFFPGSGRVAVESALASVIEPGDKMLALVNGVFSRWMKETAERLGANIIELGTDWRGAFDPSEVERRLERERDVKLVSVVHNETATGVKNPVAKIGEIVHKREILYVADVVSSLGGDDVRTDEWNIDLGCAGSYKCLNAPPGLAIVSISDEAWKVMENRRKPASTFSFDLYKWLQMWVPKEKGGKLIWGYRRHPIEPAPHLTYALNEAIKQILEEGLDERFRKNAAAGRALRAGVRALGLDLYPKQERDASNTVTAVMNPENIANKEILEIMRNRYGVIAGGGVEETHDKVIRLAHMSVTSQPVYVLQTILGLGSTLEELGMTPDVDDALASTREALRPS